MNKSIVTRAWVRGLAVFAAVIVSYHFAHAEKCWLLIAVFCAMQTAVGVAFRQGVERIVTVGACAMMGSLCVLLIPYPIVIAMLVVLIVSVCVFYTDKDYLNRFTLTLPFLAAIILMIAMLLPITQVDMLYARLSDIMLGGVIGLAANLAIFPTRVDVEFRDNIVPILTAYRAYLPAIVNLLLQKNDAAVAAKNKEDLVERSLQTQSAYFPVWVYEAGLSVALRQGYRHFLVTTEKVGQILFSMHYLARQSIDKELVEELREPIEVCVTHVEKLFSALISVLMLQKLPEVVNDFSEELDGLETLLKAIIPASPELLDLSPDYIYLTAFVADLRDLRVGLLQLAQALPGDYSIANGSS